MKKPLHILLVEDDIIDVKCVKRALDGATVSVTTEVAGDGREALRILRKQSGEDQFGPAPMPTLILADLNMPIMNGLELLDELKQDHMLRKIPVVVLTTSNSQRDVDASYARGAAGYIVKPMESEALRQALEQLQQYWSICEAPELTADWS